MKKLLFSFCAVAACTTAAFAGTSSYSGKEMKNTVQQQTCPEWYATNEFNLNVWGTYAFTSERWREDRYLGVDHAWGGGIDAKYFFARYFGIGIEGFGLNIHGDRDVLFLIPGGARRELDRDRSAAGGVLGTLTLRYPIPCTRFAPYAWIGGGGIWNGSDRDELFYDANATLVAVRRRDSEGKLLGQVGGGLEVRFTPHFGWTNDFSWNVVDGPKNNFGMVRTGLNFAF